MNVYITSSIKKHFNTYIEFIDYYWINFFKKYNIDYEILPCDKSNSLKRFNIKKGANSILIITGGSDVKTTHNVFFKRKFLKYKKIEKVNSYHNYCIKMTNKKNFEVLAVDNKNRVEFLIYKKINYLIMWHPERNKNYNELKTLIKSLSPKKRK